VKRKVAGLHRGVVNWQKAGKSFILMQLGEKVRLSGKEAACYLEAKPECGFVWRDHEDTKHESNRPL